MNFMIEIIELAPFKVGARDENKSTDFKSGLVDGNSEKILNE